MRFWVSNRILKSNMGHGFFHIFNFELLLVYEDINVIIGLGWYLYHDFIYLSGDTILIVIPLAFPKLKDDVLKR